MRPVSQSRVLIGFLLVGMSAIPCHGNDARTEELTAVAEAFTKAARNVYSTDWIYFDIPLDRLYSDDELAILGDHLPSLQSLIESALERQDSVSGAKLAGHFNMSELLPLLRRHFLTPRHCYGWEGPDYSKLESYLADHQYQYSVGYLEAIEAITGEDIAAAVVITESEVREIERLASLEKSPYYHWALWIQRKLKISGQQNPRDPGTK